MFRFISQLFSAPKKTAPRPTYKPQLEALENRELMSVSPINVAGDLAPTSREAYLGSPYQPTPAGLALINSLPNTPVRTTALADYQRDGLITRNDLIDIFNKGSSGFTDLTNPELSSLQTLVNNGSTLLMPDYVQNLASKVLISIPYGTGTSAQNLQKGVNDFFLGADRPQASQAYGQASGPLWNGSGPSYKDVGGRGEVYDQWLFSAMREVAYRDPNAIKQMFIDNGDGTYTVRFYTYNSSKPDYVTVDNYLPGGSSVNITGPLWPLLLEKAYAQENAWGEIGSFQPHVNAYYALEQSDAFPGLGIAQVGDGDPRWAFRAITGMDGAIGTEGGYASTTVNANEVADAWSQGQFVLLHTDYHGGYYAPNDDASKLLNTAYGNGGQWWHVVDVHMGSDGNWVSLANGAVSYWIEVDFSDLSYYFDIEVMAPSPAGSSARLTTTTTGLSSSGTNLAAATTQTTTNTYQVPSKTYQITQNTANVTSTSLDVVGMSSLLQEQNKTTL
jgi:hypothetical protein